MYEIDILGEIGDYGYPSNYLRYQLKDAGSQDIQLNVSSPGGSVTDGLAMFDMLEAYEGNVNTLGFGLVASIASVILLAGKRVKMTPNSFLMIHNPWMVAIGDSAEISVSAELLAKMEKKLQNIYVSKLQKSGKLDGNIELKVKRMMDMETWLTADEAFDMGFIDEIQQATKTANILQMQPALARYINTPAALLINSEDMTAKEILKSARALLGIAEEPEVVEATVPPAQDPPAAPQMTAEEAIAFLQSTGYKVMTAEELAAMTAQRTEAEEMNTQLAETMQALESEMTVLKAQVKQGLGAPSGASKQDGVTPKETPKESRFDGLAAIWNSKINN
jgi:ATP-dependent Clp protease protease subunit